MVLDSIYSGNFDEIVPPFLIPFELFALVDELAHTRIRTYTFKILFPGVLVLAESEYMHNSIQIFGVILSEIVGRIDVDSTSTRRSHVDGEIKSKYYLNFRQTLYLLKTALECFPERTAMVLQYKGSQKVLCHSDVETTSTRQIRRNLV